MTDAVPMMALEDDYVEIREQVAKLCDEFPGEYWRKLDAERAYPTEFVQHGNGRWIEVLHVVDEQCQRSAFACPQARDGGRHLARR